MTTRSEVKPTLPSTAKDAEVYDFRRPTTLAREHSRVLELAFETFARQWGTQLTAKVRVRSQVNFEFVSMHTYDEYAASLPSTTAMVLLALAGHDSKAVIQLPTLTALGWFSHMLGGNGSHNETERKFTQIEQSMMRKLMADAIDDLRYSFGPLLSADIVVDSIHHNSQFAQAAATSELMIVASFTVQVGERASHATLAIPADVLLRQLGAANPVINATDAADLIQNQVSHVPVDVAVQFPGKRVWAADILALAVGDLIPLGHAGHKPLDVAVDGHTLAYAAVGATGSRMACVITEIQENN
ncbi:flagellar motor switch protein FliM [Glaciibacter psychrotolerans]|uniref:Flagellar motor switch protein FliM n=1 Tax=Glaciibacter psychrotolerans TaxID=670054 RepID=A0A7Z0J4W6_9MICO|nr:flagellar motor switch protein FliM [Leifsonia psychrotolerans]NYJ18770.1 flagellar motor switch protein FliM [Leifsonia psychrotolerans]